MNDTEIAIIRKYVSKDRDPVAAACAVMGSMAGIVASYADRSLAVSALRMIADSIELAHKAADARRCNEVGKDTRTA